MSRKRGMAGEAAARGAVIGVLAVAVLIVLTRSLPFRDVHDPWIDEASLIVNFPLDGLADFFRPLPYYELAAPLGYSLLLQAVHLLFPADPVAVLRLVSAVASIFAVGFLFAALRLAGAGPALPLTLAFASLTPFIVRYSLETKPYIFEYLATAFAIYAALRLAFSPGGRNVALFLAAGVFAIVFSFTAPLTIGACGAGILAHRALNGPPRFVSALNLRVVAALAGLTAVFLVYYLGYTQPVTADQFGSWQFYYQRNFLTFPPLSAAALREWLMLPRFLFFPDDFLATVFGTAYLPTLLRGAIAAASLILVVAGVVSLGRRLVFFSAALGFALVLVYALNLAGLLPIVFARHFICLVPFAGIVLGYGAAACLRRAARWAGAKRAPALLSAGTVLVVAAIGAAGLWRASDLAREELTPLLEHIAARDGGTGTPVWVYYGAQPAMRVLAPKTMPLIGMTPPENGPLSWIWRHRDFPRFVTSDAYFDTFRDTIRGLPALWLIFSHNTADPDLGPFREIAEREIGNCLVAKKAVGSQLWHCGAGGGS